MKKIFITLLFWGFCNLMHAITKPENDSLIPVTKAFYKIGTNTIRTFTYNCGANIIVGTIGTYGLVHSGFDWEWNRLAYKNNAMANSGMPSVAIGGLIPLVVPAYLYFSGRNKRDMKLQITGLALAQAAILGAGITSTIKVFTGRKPPGILDKKFEQTDYSTDFHFGLLRRGAFNGWPSGHTTTAFAMAATLIELYPDNTPLKIGALTYAGIIGLGVSVNIHWFSDAFAGALLGYALGKTIGRSYSQLLYNKPDTKSAFIITPTGFKYTYSLR